MTRSHVERVWTKVVQQNEFSAHAGEWNCPNEFKYPIHVTVMQMVRLSKSLIGMYIDTQTLHPGESSRLPVIHCTPELRSRSVRRWLKEVEYEFGRYLTESQWKEINDEANAEQNEEREKRQALVAEKPRPRTEEEAARSERLERRMAEMREKRLAKRRATDRRRRAWAKSKRDVMRLFGDYLPDDHDGRAADEVAFALGSIADTLTAESKPAIRWRELKQRWPSVTDRFRNDIMWLDLPDPISVERLRNICGGQEFKLSTSVWESWQRIFAVPQLVVHVCAFDAYRDLRIREDSGMNDTEIKDLNPHFKHVEDAVGWLRVHVDTKNQLFFVDEVQSDVIEALRKRRGPAGDQFISATSRWHLFGFGNLCRWAMDAGFRAAIHSRESAATIPGMTKSDRKWNEYYQSIIKRFRLVLAEMDGYPGPIHVQKSVGGPSGSA
ncbi:MAG: hypothetical protein JJU36_02715 [Phycisphaeraceae bacterium]|nr:hypothetical protein [Phycisphaeraceae bacterium]